MTTTAYIIIIGDEMLLGNVADINTSYLARGLSAAGFNVVGSCIVGDNAEAIERETRRALSEADVVLTAGGLGPTKDDITRDAMMKIFGGKLRHDKVTAENVHRVMAERGREMNDLTEAQAMVPDSCTVLTNRVGTAPVMAFSRNDKPALVAMPGVPFELKIVFDESVLPYLTKAFSMKPVAHAWLQTFNISESEVAMLLEPVDEATGAHIAYLPQTGWLNLRFDAEAQEVADFIRDMATYYLDNHCWGFDDRHPAFALIQDLIDENLTIAIAESCTGGNIAHHLTLVPGSSAAMLGGVVAYSNEVKKKVLGVPEELLEKHGAVSEPVARAMAEGVRRVLGSDVGVATTGIAGPGGGSEQKPVGTVWIAVATENDTIARVYHFAGDRPRVIEQATALAIIMALGEVAWL